MPRKSVQQKESTELKPSADRGHVWKKLGKDSWYWLCQLCGLLVDTHPCAGHSIYCRPGKEEICARKKKHRVDWLKFNDSGW